MSTKPLRDIVRGETFRPAGSPAAWQLATGDARFDKQRGICVVDCQPIGEVRGLGHLVCEVNHG
ncbi:MAG TPA: hypothetical protein VJY33_23010 [Isosphaeraceae bacterium]|nr:hypothetical protein [Isosphaeraceae bacterium]